MSEYLVFSAGGIQGTHSDFQGPTGAAGDINFPENFQISSQSESCAVLVAGGSIRAGDGKIQGGNVEARGDIRFNHETFGTGAIAAGGMLTENGLSDTPYEQRVTDNVQRLPSVAQDLESRSRTIGDLTPNAQANGYPYLPLSFDENGLPFRVYTVTAGQLERAYSINFQADQGQLVIVNVTGDSIDLRNKSINLSSKLSTQPGQVFFNFPDAKSVYLSRDGGASDFPATILAPHAKVTLDHLGIHGGVYAGSIVDDHGQVNAVSVPWDSIDAYVANHAGDPGSCHDSSWNTPLMMEFVDWIRAFLSSTQKN